MKLRELWDTLSGPICTLWESQQKRKRDRKVQEIMSKIKTANQEYYIWQNYPSKMKEK